MSAIGALITLASLASSVYGAIASSQEEEAAEKAKKKQEAYEREQQRIAELNQKRRETAQRRDELLGILKTDQNVQFRAPWYQKGPDEPDMSDVEKQIEDAQRNKNIAGYIGLGAQALGGLESLGGGTSTATTTPDVSGGVDINYTTPTASDVRLASYTPPSTTAQPTASPSVTNRYSPDRYYQRLYGSA